MTKMQDMTFRLQALDIWGKSPEHSGITTAISSPVAFVGKADNNL